METIKKYKVSNNNRLRIHVQWSAEIESLINKINEHLINACQHFRAKKATFSFDKDLFRNDSVSLAIFHMLYNIEKSLLRYEHECYLKHIELNFICSYITQLEILENAVEEYYKELEAVNINPEYILSDLHKAISELQVFLHKFNLTA